MKVPVSQILVRFLEKLGVGTIFGIPGSHILPVYDRLYDSPIRSILVKHEQAAAFMAGGYWPAAMPVRPVRWAPASPRPGPAPPTL
jgi:thiamine pyrophosphate-dependent acetolactate synthase large subunit-like protein